MRSSDDMSKSLRKITDTSQAPNKEYITIQSNFKNYQYYKSSLSKYYIKEHKTNSSKIGEIYYDHFKDSCEILLEKKAWAVQRIAQINKCAVDLSKIKLSKGKLLLLDLDECLLHSEFTEVYKPLNESVNGIYNDLDSLKKGVGFWMNVDEKNQCWVYIFLT